MDGRYLLPMFARLVQAEPDRAVATAVIASAKDYLFAWLTGALATDPSTAAGYGCYELETGRWNAAVRTAAACTVRSRQSSPRPAVWRDPPDAGRGRGPAGLRADPGRPGRR